MSYQDIRAETRGQASWIVMHRPETMSAVRPQTYVELCRVCEAADADRQTL
jgi:1,4-dihydroxy-2-naphthoyl-CoA synthase